MKGGPCYVTSSKRQEVYTEQNYLLESVFILAKVAVSVGDTVVRILLHKGKDIKISL